MLLSHGCDPSAVAHNNKTAQQVASEEEHRETVTVLQAATAKVSITIIIYRYRVQHLLACMLWSSSLHKSIYKLKVWHEA